GQAPLSVHPRSALPAPSQECLQWQFYASARRTDRKATCRSGQAVHQAMINMLRLFPVLLPATVPYSAARTSHLLTLFHQTIDAREIGRPCLRVFLPDGSLSASSSYSAADLQPGHCLSSAESVRSNAGSM